jgi:hypothetical protein
MNWLELFSETFMDTAKTVVIITTILVLLMIVLELLKDGRLIEKAVPLLQPATRFSGLPNEAVLPLLAGLFFGIAYGSGFIISFSKDGNLSKRDMMLICIFLSVCHGMIEDPLIFAAIGASWWTILAVRAGLGLIVIMVGSKLAKPSRG